MQSNGLTGRTVLWALTLQTAAVAWLTWPLAAHLHTHLPDTSSVCRFDARLVAFVLAHESRALVSAPSTLTDLGVYHPAPHTLFYGEGAFGALLYFMPTFLATGNPALALNLTLLVSLVLTATALHLVVVRWSGSHAGGALAGLTFLSSRWVHWLWVPGAPNYAVIYYLPLVVLVAADPAPRRRTLLVLLGLVVLQGLSSVYLAAATLAPLALLALARAGRPSTRRAGLALLLVLAGAALVLLVAYSGYLVVRAENPDLPLQTMWKVRTFEGRMIIPRHLVDEKFPTSVPVAVFWLVIAGAASLGLGGWWRLDERTRQGWRHGLFWTVVGLVIALTPFVEVGSESLGFTTVPLPQALLARFTPLYEVVREAHRLGVAALMGLALLAGLAGAEGARRLAGRLPASVGRGVAAAGVLALAAVMYAQVWREHRYQDAPNGPRVRAYPLSPADAHSTVLMPILRQPGGPLLEVDFPTLERNVLDPAGNAAAMYRAIDHRRRLLNGYSGYWPAAFAEHVALIKRLPDPAALRALRERTGVELILVHDRNVTEESRKNCALLAGQGFDVDQCRPETIRRRRAPWYDAMAGRRKDLRFVARDGDDLLFAVN